MDYKKQQNTYHINRYTRNQSTFNQMNCCIDCGIDMGEYNPRQLCGKWRCLFVNADNENIINY